MHQYNNVTHCPNSSFNSLQRNEVRRGGRDSDAIATLSGSDDEISGEEENEDSEEHDSDSDEIISASEESENESLNNNSDDNESSDNEYTRLVHWWIE